ncbi:MAG TPA: hypothetical protein VIR02_05115 [Anaerolineales bacterium]
MKRIWQLVGGQSAMMSHGLRKIVPQIWLRSNLRDIVYIRISK